MRKVIVLLAACGLIASAATCVSAQSKVKPEETKKVVTAKPASGNLLVNDFHIRFKGQIQKADQAGILQWLDVQLADVDQSQLHCSQPGLKSATMSSGWIDLNFTFPDTTITPTQGVTFGFGLKGGASITEYECWWTYNGANVKNVAKVVPGAKVDSGKPKTTVSNLQPSPVALQRKTGKSTGKPTMSELAGMDTLPDEQLYDPTPFNLPALSIAEIEWPEPPLEPGVVSRTYYTKTFFTADGTKVEYTEAFTIQVIPEPATCLGLAAGLLGFVGMIRRKK